MNKAIQIFTLSLGFSVFMFISGLISNDIEYILTETNEYLRTVTIKAHTLLGLVAIFIYAAAGRNYVLATVTNLKERMKEINIRRIYGASRMDIIKLTFHEGLYMSSCTLILSCLLLWAASPMLENTFQITPEAYMNKGLVIMAFASYPLLIITTGIVPGIIYCHQSVIENEWHSHDKKRWRTGMLAMQSLFTSLLISMVILVFVEYNYLTNHPELITFPLRSIEIFGNVIFVGCISAIVIMMMGFGLYIRHEIYNRSREAAIRRAYGCSRWQIILLFTKRILLIIIPSSFVGMVIGTGLILITFSNTIDYPQVGFATGPTSGLSLVLSTVSLQVFFIATLVICKAYILTRGSIAKTLRIKH